MAGDNGIQSINKDEHIVVGGLQAKQVLPFAYESSAGTYRTLMVNASGQLETTAVLNGGVNITSADGAITDGAVAAIRATVLSLPSGNSVLTSIVDSNGTPLTVFPVSLSSLPSINGVVTIDSLPTVSVGNVIHTIIDSLPTVSVGNSLNIASLPTVAVGNDIAISSLPTVNVGNSVTIGSLPSIDGNVAVSSLPTVIVGNSLTISSIPTVNAYIDKVEAGTVTNTRSIVAEVSTLVLSANANRTYLGVVNDSLNSIYLSLSSLATVNNGLLLRPAGSLELQKDATRDIYTGTITAIVASGASGSNLTVIEAV